MSAPLPTEPDNPEGGDSVAEPEPLPLGSVATARRRRSPAAALHAFAAAVGVADTDLDAVILAVTGGRSESAKDLTLSEDGQVRVLLRSIADGHYPMVKVHDAVVAFRARAAS